MSAQLLIDLPVRSEWSNVERVRTAMVSCFAAASSDLDDCRMVATVISELLENAIKYGACSNRDGHFIHLEVNSEKQRVVVTVEHPVEPASADVARLKEILAWLTTFARPEDAYRARLSELAEHPPEGSASRLGLARLAYEGNCALSAEVVGSTLRVSAEMVH